MGRRKLKIQFIQDDKTRNSTLYKRKQGLMKKAYELSTLCHCEIGFMIFDHDGRLAQFASSDMDQLLLRYTGYSEPSESRNNADFERLMARKALEQANASGNTTATRADSDEEEVEDQFEGQGVTQQAAATSEQTRQRLSHRLNSLRNGSVSLPAPHTFPTQSLETASGSSNGPMRRSSTLAMPPPLLITSSRPVSPSKRSPPIGLRLNIGEGNSSAPSQGAPGNGPLSAGPFTGNLFSMRSPFGLSSPGGLGSFPADGGQQSAMWQNGLMSPTQAYPFMMSPMFQQQMFQQQMQQFQQQQIQQQMMMHAQQAANAAAQQTSRNSAQYPAQTVAPAAPVTTAVESPASKLATASSAQKHAAATPSERTVKKARI